MRHNPQPQELYRHFKGNLYQIRCLAEHSETGEILVIYQAMYGDFKIYARPLSMFMEEVDLYKYPDASQKYRFELQGGGSKEDESFRREPQGGENSKTVFDNAAVSSHERPQTDEKPQADERPQAADTEEINIDPLLLQFLDTGSYRRRLEILDMLHGRINDRMIDTMAVALDLEVQDGDVEDRYMELRNCLLTFGRYETNRLRQ